MPTETGKDSAVSQTAHSQWALRFISSFRRPCRSIIGRMLSALLSLLALFLDVCLKPAVSVTSEIFMSVWKKLRTFIDPKAHLESPQHEIQLHVYISSKQEVLSSANPFIIDLVRIPMRRATFIMLIISRKEEPIIPQIHVYPHYQ